jgi:glycine cleavage system H protein
MMAAAGSVFVAGFALVLDRRYEADTHMWVLAQGPRRVRVGMDALGLETSGSLSQLSFDPPGTELVAGRPFGQLEAAKFVGPLVSPVTGTVLAVNDAVAIDAGLAERDPYGEGWLIEASLDGDEAELGNLLSEPDEIVSWFTAKATSYRLKGVIAQ